MLPNLSKIFLLTFDSCLLDKYSGNSEKTFLLSKSLSVNNIPPFVKGGWEDFPKAGQSKSPYVFFKGNLNQKTHSSPAREMGSKISDPCRPSED
jgi:hypothetical protein